STGSGISHYVNGTFHNYGTNDGLPAASYWRSLSDAQGRLWFGSLQHSVGAAMFDGSKFQIFTTANGLAGNTINSFFSDPDGTVWIGTDNGVSCYSGTNFVATYSRARDRLAHNSVQAIYRDSRGVLWFGTPAGATRFDGNYWSTLTKRDGLMGN